VFVGTGQIFFSHTFLPKSDTVFPRRYSSFKRLFSNSFAAKISPGSYTNLRFFTKIIAIEFGLSNEISKQDKVLPVLKGMAIQFPVGLGSILRIWFCARLKTKSVNFVKVN